MKLIKINISNDIEEVVKYKAIVEDYWLNITKEIDRNITIEEFITKLDMSKNLFVTSKNEVIPFKYFDINGAIYFFYVTENTDIVNSCIDLLKEFEFNTSKLSTINDKDVFEGKLVNKDYFIIDGNYQLYEKH